MGSNIHVGTENMGSGFDPSLGATVTRLCESVPTGGGRFACSLLYEKNRQGKTFFFFVRNS